MAAQTKKTPRKGVGRRRDLTSVKESGDVARGLGGGSGGGVGIGGGNRDTNLVGGNKSREVGPPRGTREAKNHAWTLRDAPVCWCWAPEGGGSRRGHFLPGGGEGNESVKRKKKPD